MSASWACVLSLVSGTTSQTARAARAQVVPWKRKRAWRPYRRVAWGISFTSRKAVEVLGEKDKRLIVIL